MNGGVASDEASGKDEGKVASSLSCGGRRVQRRKGPLETGFTCWHGKDLG